MSEPISTITNGIDEVKEHLCEFLHYALDDLYRKDLQQDKKRASNWWFDSVFNHLTDDFKASIRNNSHPSLYDLDFGNSVKVFLGNWDRLSSEIGFDELMRCYIHEIKAIRNKTAHASTHEASIQTPDYSARALDTMRRFISQLLLYINQHRIKGKELMMPEFAYAITQPEDSRVLVDSKVLLKTKTTDYIPVRPSSYDFSKAKLPVSKVTIEEIIEDFQCIKPGESVLVVKTIGDLFQFDADGNGYTGDWLIEVKVTKIIIIHFYEGSKGEKAHVYMADFVKNRPETKYSPLRYRYFFKDILSCGTITADFTSDFDSCQLISKRSE